VLLGFRFDASRWPLVEVSWTETVSDADVVSFTQKMDEWFARGSDFGLLVDARGAPGLSGSQRRTLLAHMKATQSAADRYLVVAFVSDSALQRAFYFSLTWAFPMPFPSRAFPEVEPAVQWLKAHLDERAKAGAKR
jgi:hypothetical protein